MSIVVVPAATEELRAKAFALRHTVFVGEQAVPVELEHGIAHVVMRKPL